ncbi:MAG: RlmE family RNA methyltransferase [Chloroflexi bacterium]|nr:RlmE family RNA methyltransferase [Chloroflexota bacterium]
MGGHWRKNQGQDRYFRQAKEEGYRSRSAFKLEQINSKFAVIRKGDRVLDLGAAPGGWSQITQKWVGPQGRVIAVDLQAMDPIPGVTIITGDMLAPEVQARLHEAAQGQVDVVLCDAAPATSGIRDRDHARSIELAEMALALARELLKPGGHFVVKVFEGEYFPGFLQEARRWFASVKPHHPDASREESREMYVVAQRLRAAEPPPA